MLLKLVENENLTPSERISFDQFYFKLQLLEDISLISVFPGIDPPDTLNKVGLIGQAINYLVQSRPDNGIPLLLKYLSKSSLNADSAAFAKIYLTEAYRQKQEYAKAIDMLYDIMNNPEISQYNLAFAFNRMAALYNECKWCSESRLDSVSKYSHACILISKNTDTLNTLQHPKMKWPRFHETGQLDSALLYVSGAKENFISIQMIPQAINAIINMGGIYNSMKQPVKSRNILMEAFEFGRY
ncbi:MAG: hypothetical protein R2764_03800 [Bacteroidales bacterium]